MYLLFNFIGIYDLEKSISIEQK